MIDVRVLDASELGRIGEIDRSERITQQYKASGGDLEVIEVDIDAPRWGEPGESPVQHRIDAWSPVLEAGGLLIGAFDREDLVGFAIYDPKLSEGVAQLTALFVTRPTRGRGVGKRLAEEVFRLARADGARSVYVSATPTRATVDFYLKRGFVPLAEPDEELLALEPDDIHMELTL